MPSRKPSSTPGNDARADIIALADQRYAEPDRLEPARPVHDQVVERDQRRQIGHQHLLGDRELDERRRHHGREDHDRRTRPEQQRHDQRQRHEYLLARRGDRDVVGGQTARTQLAHHEQHRDRGDQVIAGERVPIEPGVQTIEQRVKHKLHARPHGGGVAGRGPPATTRGAACRWRIPTIAHSARASRGRL